MESMSGGRKIFWDIASRTIFVECCIEEVEKGNRPGSHFNKIGWKNLITNFNSCVGKNYTKLQLKNHWDAMKKDWKICDRLMRSESGIGWDPIRKTIDASPQWWKDKIRVDPELAKFKDKNLQMYKIYYDPLFRDNVATGDRVMAPSEMPRNTSKTNDIDDSPSELPRTSGRISDAGDDIRDSDYGLDDEISEEENDDVQDQQAPGIHFPESTLKRKASQQVSTSGKRGKISTTKSWKNQLDIVLQALINRSSATTVAPIKQDEIPTMADCVQMLAKLQGVEPRTKFWNEATLLFLNDKMRTMFTLQPTPESKLSWLENIIEKDEISPLSRS